MFRILVPMKKASIRRFPGRTISVTIGIGIKELESCGTRQELEDFGPCPGRNRTSRLSSRADEGA